MKVRRERLERHWPSKVDVVGQIDATHRATADLPGDLVVPDGDAGFERFVLRQQLRRALPDRILEKGAGLRMVVEQ